MTDANRLNLAGANFALSSPLALQTLIQFLMDSGITPFAQRIDNQVARVFIQMSTFLILNFTTAKTVKHMGHPVGAIMFRTTDPLEQAQELERRFKAAGLDASVQKDFEPGLPFPLIAFRSEQLTSAGTIDQFVILFGNPPANLPFPAFDPASCFSQLDQMQQEYLAAEETDE